MAAGMGSRYGGLKQAEGFGPRGETLLEYSVKDALRAGFSEFVFIIRKELHETMQEKVFSRLEQWISPVVVYQETERTPVPQPEILREKPWGTAHAVWSVKDAVDNPFAVINADDFYGEDAFVQLAHFLRKEENDFCMVAYHLQNTLSEVGAVSRGVCTMDDERRLLRVEEHHEIKREGPRIASDHGDLPADQLVSMNCWGLQPSIFEEIEELWVSFVEQLVRAPKAELYLPSVVQASIDKKNRAVHVLATDAQWFGVTYAEEKTLVQEKIRALRG